MDELTLPRLYTPNTTPSASPNSGASLSLHVQASYPGGSFAADGESEFGPGNAWMYLHFRRSGDVDEYMTIGPAPNGVGGNAPVSGPLMGSDSVRIAVFDDAAGAVVFVEDARATLSPDLLSGNFNGVWKGGTASINLNFTCT